MKKDTREKKSPKRRNRERKSDPMTIGIDLGDKTSRFCVVDGGGEVVAEASVATTNKGMAQAFATSPRCRIALEVGTHSAWVSRLLTSFGHEVYVANARELRAISASSRKDDRMDARMLARLARVDPELLRPIRHRSEQAQADLMQIRVRATLVETRTALINSARGLAKTTGERLRQCDADQMGAATAEAMPEWLRESLRPLLTEVERLTEQIHALDAKIAQIARSGYPETKLLEQVWGVGPLIALTFVLTVEDPYRFGKSRDVGCYMGLRPRRSESGERKPELRITKEGDRYLRTMLVQGAHCIVSSRAPDTDLKRWGVKLAGRGGRSARKRAVVAVARKLAVLLHHLWVSGEVYEPLRNSRMVAAAA
jgi:transposase